MTEPIAKPAALAPPASRRSENDDVGDDECVETTAFDYLQTHQGHEVAQRLMTIFEKLADAKVNRDAAAAKLERYIQVGIIVLVVAASTTLAIVDKFNATIGLLFGSLVGYVLGRRAR